MENAYTKDFIKLGKYDETLATKEDCKLNIFKCHPYCEGAIWDEMEISFCPFCGKEIETKIIQIPEEQLKQEHKTKNKRQQEQIEKQIEYLEKQLETLK
jgi:hypothetical protein